MKVCPNRACPFLKQYGEVAEYRDEIVRCIDCGTLLIEGASVKDILPETASNEETSAVTSGGALVVIATFDHPWQAHLHRAHLVAKGIPAFLFDEHTIANNWLYSNALGGVRLAVPESARAVALAILDQSDA